MGFTSIDNSVVLRSLFREITRGLRKIRTQPVLLNAQDTSSSEFKREVKKALIDNSQYREYLLSEIRHTVLQKLSVKPKNTHIKDHIVHSQLWQGHNLVEKLNAIHQEPSNSLNWKELVDLVLSERKLLLLKNKWTLDYKAHKKVIDEGRLKELHPLKAKQLLSKQREKKSYINDSSDKGYKLRLAESNDNASWVVRNYLKRLQLSGKIPNPFKLAYVSENMHQQALQLPKIVNLLPGSTKTNVLESAYDMDYVDAILKPEIEYLLNKKHYLEKYQNIVNKKGPAKVQIRSTLAGIMQAHFIRSPIKDELEMKRIAIDVKKLTRVIRKQFIWKLGTSQTESLSERMVGEGYAVRGSQGFSIDEIMYPRKYHEDLVLKEAEWEYLMKIEELKAKYGQNVMQDARVSNQLDKLRQQIVEGWIAPLNIATKAIDDEVELYFLKYKITDSSPIWKKRDLLQERMNMNYERTSRKFGELIENLRRDRVCAHSDLFYRSSKDKQGKKLPEKERALGGKSLGNYLEEVGLSGYKMGYEYRKRLNIA